MRLRGTGASSSAVKDLTTTQSSGGRKRRIDKKRQFTPSPPGAQHAETPRLQTEDPHRSTVHRRQSRSTRLIMQQPWRSHQSVPIAVKNQGGDCQYALCPGLKRNNLRKRPYPTRYQCEECSIKKGRPVWLCNSTKKHADGSSRRRTHPKRYFGGGPNGIFSIPKQPESRENAKNYKAVYRVEF